MKTRRLINLVLILSLLLTGGMRVVSAAPPQQEEVSYTVKLGDNLWTLAEKYLGGGWIYPAIVAATNQKHAEDSTFAEIKDANLIHPGWKLWIPTAEEAAALVEAYTITLYHMGDITGPYGPITMPLVDGFNDAVAYLNAHGGIRGARVKIGWSDTGGKLEESISIYNRFREADPKPVLLFTYSSPENEALRDRFAEDEIPVLTAGLSEASLYPTGWVFGIVPIYTDQFGFFVDWLVENWAEVKPANAGDKPVLAFVTWDTAYGRGHDTEVARAYAKDKGVEIVATEYFAMGAPDVTTQLLAAQAAGANVIWTNTLAHGPAQILKDATALGLRDDILITGNNWALDLATIALAGASGEGFYGIMPTSWWTETDVKGVQLAQEQFVAKNRPPAEHNIAYLLAFAMVDVAREAIEMAIDEVGFDGLDGAAVYAALQELSDYKALGGVLILSFDETIRAPHAIRMGKIQGGNIVAVTDWQEAPDLRTQR